MKNIKTFVFRTSLLALLVLGFMFGPSAQPASAVNCRERWVNVPYGYYYVEMFGGVRYNYAFETSPYAKNNLFTVPSSYESGCSYINLKNIQGGWGSGGQCWSFRLWNRTTGALSAESGYCAGPNTVVGLGYAPVANGTRYNVLLVENHNLNFIIRD